MGSAVLYRYSKARWGDEETDEEMDAGIEDEPEFSKSLWNAVHSDSDGNDF